MRIGYRSLLELSKVYFYFLFLCLPCPPSETRMLFRLKIWQAKYQGGLIFSDLKIQISSLGVVWWLYDVGDLGFSNHVASPFLIGSFYLMVQEGCSSFTVCLPFRQQDWVKEKIKSMSIFFKAMMLTSHCPELSHKASPSCKGIFSCVLCPEISTTV